MLWLFCHISWKMFRQHQLWILRSLRGEKVLNHHRGTTRPLAAFHWPLEEGLPLEKGAVK